MPRSRVTPEGPPAQVGEVLSNAGQQGGAAFRRELMVHGQNLVAILRAGGGILPGGIAEIGSGVRVIGPEVRIIGEGTGDETTKPGGRRGRREQESDWDAERERIRGEERASAEAALNQRIQELSQELRVQVEATINQRIEQAVTPLHQQIGELTTRVGELEAERDVLQTQLAERDAEIARLTALLHGVPPAPGGPTAPEELTADQLHELHGQIATARNDLVDITIRRKSRTFFDRLIPWRRGEQAEYNQALQNYTTLTERMQNHERAYRSAAGHNEADIVEGQEDEVYGDLNSLAQEVYNVNRNRVRYVREHGNLLRRNWAHVTWFWGNRPVWQKILATLGVGAGVAAVSATAGLGLAFLAAGAGLKFSVSYFNNRSAVRNLAQGNLEREQARIQQAHQNLQNRRAGASIDQRRRQMGSDFRNTHESNVRRDRLWNTIGKTAMVGGGVVASLAAAGVEFMPSILDAFRDHNNATASKPTVPEQQAGTGKTTETTPSDGGKDVLTGIDTSHGHHHIEVFNKENGDRSVQSILPGNLTQNPVAGGYEQITDTNTGEVIVDHVTYGENGRYSVDTIRELQGRGYKVDTNYIEIFDTTGRGPRGDITHKVSVVTAGSSLTEATTGTPNQIPGSGTPPGQTPGVAPDQTPSGGKVPGQIPDVGPGKATSTELANTHVEPLPKADDSLSDTTAVRLQNGYHLKYGGVDANGERIINIVDPKNDIIARDISFTRTGAVTNLSILDAGLYHGPNEYFQIHPFNDPRHFGRTISTLILKDQDKLSDAA